MPYRKISDFFYYGTVDCAVGGVRVSGGVRIDLNIFRHVLFVAVGFGDNLEYI